MVGSKITFRALTNLLHDGVIDRRRFLQASAAIGVSASASFAVANHIAAQTPVATPDGEWDRSGRPATGTADQERGSGGQLRLMSWQPATVLAAHSATGSKDTFAGALVMEPLMAFSEDAQLLPILIEDVPSIDNGLLSEDLVSATFRFLPDLVWSDGEPVTAQDLIFTWQWITEASNGSINVDVWNSIENIEAQDEKTAVVTFKSGRVTWYEPFTGVAAGILYPAHIFNNDPANRNEDFLTNPIGTGPYKVESFAANDQVVYGMNENYREPNKPFFSEVYLKGGGDALSAARAVVQTGDFDYADNIQAEPEIIESIRESGTAGEIISLMTDAVERIYLNFSDPQQDVDGERSQKDTPHPLFADDAVREAMNLAVDRTLIASEFFGEPDSATANILAGSEAFESPNTSWSFDLEQANRILDEAGWGMNGDVREKDGHQLSVAFATTVNPVRQKTQAVVKDAFAQIGIQVNLEQVDAGVFFDSSPGNDLNYHHFHWDLVMFSSSPPIPISPRFMSTWYAGENDENIAQAANEWTGQNFQRYRSGQYDQLYEQLLTTTTQEEAIDLLIQMNDTVIADRALIPLVARTFYHAVGNRLNRANMQLENNWVGPYDNIANWNTVEQ
jgi:peptide/nickel transport system substrate-binding protein